MSKQWQKMRKHDQYYKQAKTYGYRSRAAYKLKQINKKFRILQHGDYVLDLGAAPGGWTQVALEIVGSRGKVIGIDLEPITKINNATFLIGDITNDGIVESIARQIEDKKFDVIISDAAPNISGNYSIDQAKSVYLAESALNLAVQLLKPNGNLVIKVFEGEDFQQFFLKIKKVFRISKKFSPKASRARSSEIYVIGLDYQSKN